MFSNFSAKFLLYCTFDKLLYTPMKEEFLHFLWKYSYHSLSNLTTSSGEQVEVISPGIHNLDAGPDFFNAKIRINQTVWAGNVEIHIKASDWNRHDHDTDKSYDSVILHVVASNDVEVKNSKGDIVQTIEIPYPSGIDWELQRMFSSKQWIACADLIGEIDKSAINIWLSRLSVERLEQKTQYILSSVEQNGNSWEDSFYQSVARSFGLKINALPFELMAKNTPLKVLAKAKDNLFVIESILFGQSGLLFNDIPEDEYVTSLRKEYDYQHKKYSLTPVNGELWKFLRLRPVSFPTIRIAQLAMLIHKSSGLFSKIMEAEDANSITKLLNVGVSDYWKTHYSFGKPSTERLKNLGNETIRVILLNSVIPFMFAYGKARGNEDLADKAIVLLESLKPEQNSVVAGFKKLGVEAPSAMFSQAMVQLKSQYCDQQKCLFCHIGTGILLKRVTP